jgi:hypothetical protein
MRKVVLFSLVIIFACSCTKANETPTVGMDQGQLSPQMTSSVPAFTRGEKPAGTAVPTNTTSAPTPTATPESIVFTGTGSKNIDFENPYGLAIAHITGNSMKKYFSVGTFDEDSKLLAYLVNTKEPYEGIVPIDFNGIKTTEIKVSATGDWEIEVLPISAADTLEVPGTIEGSGDDVIALTGVNPYRVYVKGNYATRLMTVSSFGKDGDYQNQLVSATEPYDNNVFIKTSAAFIQVECYGKWSIKVIGK